jgi:high-affinity nickel-transport protein
MTRALAPAERTAEGRLREFVRSLSRQDRQSVGGMLGFIVLLHVVGFGVLFTLS